MAEHVGQPAAAAPHDQGEVAATGEPVAPVIVWQDARTLERIERLRAAGAEALTLALAGLPLDPYFSASKLGWISAVPPTAASSCAGVALDWAHAIGLFADHAVLDAFAGRPAIARDLAFVPALTGLACPHWDRRAAGMSIGLSLATTRGDLTRAVLEGVALRAAEVVCALGQLVPLAGPVSVDGGLVRSAYFRQFLADCLGRTVRAPQLAELTALGAAALAAPGQELPPEIAVRTTDTPPARRDGAEFRERFAAAVARAKAWRR